MPDLSTICARLCGKPECQSTGAGGRRKLRTASIPAVGMILLGITQIMYPIYEAIGLGHAKELALTGDAISAPEAYRIGLVNRICALDLLLDDAIRLGERLAARPRQALFETKRLSRELIDLNTESAMTLMFERISERLRSDEHRVQAEQYVARLHRQHADR